MRIIKFCSITAIRRKHSKEKHSKRDIFCFINDRDHDFAGESGRTCFAYSSKTVACIATAQTRPSSCAEEIGINEIKSLNVTPFLSALRAKLVETLSNKSRTVGVTAPCLKGKALPHNMNEIQLEHHGKNRTYKESLYLIKREILKRVFRRKCKIIAH